MKFGLGVNELDFTWCFIHLRVYKIMIDDKTAMIPPSLLGIDRRIACANRKYHSDWIWMGVIRRFTSIIIRIVEDKWILKINWYE